MVLMYNLFLINLYIILFDLITLCFKSTNITLEFNIGIARGTQDLEELSSVGNSRALHESRLIEAFNLKAAIEYQLKNCELIFLKFLFPIT
jgi:hypothetical protein